MRMQGCTCGQGSLFAIFREKIGDPLKKESFTTIIFHKMWQEDPLYAGVPACVRLRVSQDGVGPRLEHG